MGYRVPLLRGIKEPYLISHQLRKEEELEGLWKQAVRLLLLTILVYGLSAYFGIGSELTARRITEISGSEYEIYKLFFGIGQVTWGLLYTLFIIFVPALFLWTLLDSEYHKLISIQYMVVLILLVEKLVNIPLYIYMGLNNESSLFSFGIMAQAITSKELLIYFFSSITLFKIWTFILQYKYLKVISEKSPRFIILILLGMHLFFVIVSALLSTIHLEKLI
ncbi:hypothetical protein LLY41_02585 [Cytobacillus firmus]|uniref:hypothetical protein n=1 Tax=Cytobacillus firmus TaxID=1399 RepID=UPI002189A87C|nr:hypothetical protein [Cytobacillus firmus]URM33388.1 hypothetical protein LLY41_02585 [Cytobacillus firmus]